MNLKKCLAGHYYNASDYKECPICQAMSMGNPPHKNKNKDLNESNQVVPGVGMDNNQAMPGVGMDSNQAMPGVVMDSNQAMPGVVMDSNQAMPGVGMDNNQAMPGVGMDNNQAMPGVGMDNNQVVPGVGMDNNQAGVDEDVTISINEKENISFGIDSKEYSNDNPAVISNNQDLNNNSNVVIGNNQSKLSDVDDMNAITSDDADIDFYFNKKIDFSRMDQQTVTNFSNVNYSDMKNSNSTSVVPKDLKLFNNVAEVIGIAAFEMKSKEDYIYLYDLPYNIIPDSLCLKAEKGVKYNELLWFYYEEPLDDDLKKKLDELKEKASHKENEVSIALAKYNMAIEKKNRFEKSFKKFMKESDKNSDGKFKDFSEDFESIDKQFDKLLSDEVDTLQIWTKQKKELDNLSDEVDKLSELISSKQGIMKKGLRLKIETEEETSYFLEVDYMIDAVSCKPHFELDINPYENKALLYIKGLITFSEDNIYKDVNLSYMPDLLIDGKNYTLEKPITSDSERAVDIIFKEVEVAINKNKKNIVIDVGKLKEEMETSGYITIFYEGHPVFAGDVDELGDNRKIIF